MDRIIFEPFEKAGTFLWNKYIMHWEFGLLPKEYKPKVHGPYLPFRYYGKPDKPLSELKVGELREWIARRQKGFRPLAGMISRNYHAWVFTWFNPRYASPAGIWQGVFVLCASFYVLRYPFYYYHRVNRYHW